MLDLAARLDNRGQLTTDGHKAHLTAVEGAFGNDIDFAQLVKLYGSSPVGTGHAHKKNSPAKCNGTRKHPVTGNPDAAKISTSYAERQNLAVRMSIRRFTRLTNAFSKKSDNHFHAQALYFVFCNLTQA